MEDDSVRDIYQCVNNRIEKLSKMAYLIVKICSILYTMLSAAYSIFKYISLGYNNESFQQIYPAK